MRFPRAGQRHRRQNSCRDISTKGTTRDCDRAQYVAGSCPNIACMPSKNIIHSAKVASFFYRSNEFGISKENVRINMAAVRERKRKMVRDLVDIHLDNYKKSGAE